MSYPSTLLSCLVRVCARESIRGGDTLPLPYRRRALRSERKPPIVLERFSFFLVCVELRRESAFLVPCVPCGVGCRYRGRVRCDPMHPKKMSWWKRFRCSISYTEAFVRCRHDETQGEGRGWRAKYVRCDVSSKLLVRCQTRRPPAPAIRNLLPCMMLLLSVARAMMLLLTHPPPSLR